MALFWQLFLLASILATSHGSTVLSNNYFPLKIHLLRSKSGSGDHHLTGLSCPSWRLAVETNNIIGWTSIPSECLDYVRNYMLGRQYRDDSEIVVHQAILYAESLRLAGDVDYVGNYMFGRRYLADSEIVVHQAILYAESLQLAGDGKDIWIFDIDETSLSNLPYYAETDFGAEPINETQLYEWATSGKDPALPASLRLYNKLLSLGIQVVFLTGRPTDYEEITATNLENVGYHKWLKLILRSSMYSDKTAVFYKSSERAKLEEEGYRIVGNIGDQWSDVSGTNVGNRTFKLPNPMYYIS